MGKIFYIMGKSATGKDHIYKGLLEDPTIQMKPVVLYTTRPMRQGETNGKEYFFVDTETMQRLDFDGKIIECRRYDTIYGPWYYFTADEGQIDLEKGDYLAIGTPESYCKLRDYFGGKNICAIYIETEDGIRLARALERERAQTQPKYSEMCRRYLADEQDFSEAHLQEAGIGKRFDNNGTLEACLQEIKAYIRISQSV